MLKITVLLMTTTGKYSRKGRRVPLHERIPAHNWKLLSVLTNHSNQGLELCALAGHENPSPHSIGALATPGIAYRF